MKRILLVAGARPNFMKIAPVIETLRKYNRLQQRGSKRIGYRLVHTGQHYDTEMSGSFFRDLGIPSPDIYLGIGSGSHAEQAGRIMIEFEKICRRERPDLVMVVGDVNSTVACALVAAKLSIAVAHIEAGLRSFDRTMPEEINRLMTDQISDILFTSCEDANKNLIQEGIPKERIHFVGNVMIDTLLGHLEISNKSDIVRRLGLTNGTVTKKYALLTLHRPANVDKPHMLRGIFDALNEIASEIPIVFPVHPRTLKRLQEFKIKELINYVDLGAAILSASYFDRQRPRVLAIPPLSYLDFLCLMARAVFVLTDSGGIQEETTILGVPCLTLRNNTERPVTVREGTNCLVGNNPLRIKKNARRALRRGARRTNIPKYWDGKAAKRIVKTIANSLEN
jgi:UDP-N-acetylglucosamine 2-epimerase (non-hydrolysing)